MATINMGGNSFFTSVQEARKEARRYATATIYKFQGVVMDTETVSIDALDTKYGRWQNIYLTMSLGEGASEVSLDVVQFAMGGEIVASRDEWAWIQ